MAMDGEADSAPSAEIEQNKCVGVAIATFDVWKHTMDPNNQLFYVTQTDSVLYVAGFLFFFSSLVHCIIIFMQLSSTLHLDSGRQWKHNSTEHNTGIKI